MFISARRLIVPFLLAVLAGQVVAADKREWVTLTDWQYIDALDNDGDSFRMRSGDKGFVARLYYADVPETNLKRGERTHEQALHFGITLDETMKAGEKAKERVRQLLQKPFVAQTRWATAGGQGVEPRYYVIVMIGEKSLAEILISEGLAWPKGIAAKLPSGEKSKDYMRRLSELEAQAREKKLGAWATSTAPKTESETKIESK